MVRTSELTFTELVLPTDLNLACVWAGMLTCVLGVKCKRAHRFAADVTGSKAQLNFCLRLPQHAGGSYGDSGSG